MLSLEIHNLNAHRMFTKRKTLLDSCFFIITMIALLFSYYFDYSELAIIPLVLFFLYAYISFLIYTFKYNRVDIVKLFILLLMTYSLAGVIVFNIDIFREAFSLYSGIDDRIFSVEALFKYDLVILIANMPFLIMLSKKNSGQHLITTSNRDQLVFIKIGLLTEIFCVFFIFLLLYISLKTGREYIANSDVQGRDFILNTMGWGGVILSGLIPFSYKNVKINKTKRFFILIGLVVLLLGSLGIRMYSSIFIFLLLINLNMRGYILPAKSIFFIAIVFFILLYVAILRFNVLSFDDISVILFTMFGELIIPNLSAIFLINNPLNLDQSLVFTDLFAQLLPSVVRPHPNLYIFRDYYIAQGFDPWPIGGIFYLGQLFFYFNWMFVFVIILLCVYFSALQNLLYQKKVSLLIIAFPMLAMILPRVELWVMRSSLISLFIYLLIFALFNNLHIPMKNASQFRMANKQP